MAAQKIGKYTLVEKIGQGGMGQVWLGRDEFGHEVAIKFLGTGMSGRRGGGLRRFMREAATLSMLQHRNICRIFGIERSSDGTPVILMEHETGVSLARLMRYLSTTSAPRSSMKSALPTNHSDITMLVAQIESTPERVEEDESDAPTGTLSGTVSMLPLQQSLALVAQVCDAVQYAHERGVLHRDIKPGNIMIRRDGSAVLLDFGVAKCNQGSADAGLTGTGELFGTIDYMAPEQIVASAKVDERADVFSLGVVLYELVTGHKYFYPCGTLVTDARRRENWDPIRPRVCHRGIDKELEAVLFKAIALDPRNRYRSASQLKGDIERYQAGLPVSASSPVPFYRVVKWVRRHRLPVLLSTAVLVLAALLAGTIAWEHYRQWGKWVRVYAADYTRYAPGEFSYALESEYVSQRKPLLQGSGGLLMPVRNWMWLDTIAVRDNVRMVVRFVCEGAPDAIELVINGSRAPREQIWHLPQGYSCQVGGYSGTLDFVSVNKRSGPPSLENAVPSRIEAGRVHTVMFQRVGAEIKLFVDGHLQARATDPVPFSGNEFARLGINTYARDLRIISLDVYYQALPEKASPLTVADAFMSERLYRLAFDRYVSIANDFKGTSLSEQALYSAFLAACEMEEPRRGPASGSVQRLLQQHYPRSRYWRGVGERQILDGWRAGDYEYVLARLSDFMRMYPDSKLAQQLRHESRQQQVPDSLLKRLTGFLVRSSATGLLDIADLGIRDIDGLEGAPIFGLNADNNRIDDIRPLARSALRFLSLMSTPVQDLRALAGQPIRYLSLNRSNVASLDPVASLPLVRLHISHTPIRSLPAFSAATLKELDISGCRHISDLAPLGGLMLHSVKATACRIASVEPLRGMPLQDLDIAWNQVRDFSPLQGMPLERLDISSNPGPFTTEVLRGMPLRSLTAPSTGLLSLNGLEELPLTFLEISDNDVRDLSPVAGIVLTHLACNQNPVTSLEPLRGLPLENLSIAGTLVSSLEPLRKNSLHLLDIQKTLVTSLEPLLASAPGALLVHGTPLTSESLQRAISVWSRDPRNADLVRSLQIVRDFNRGSRGGLRRYALRSEGVDYLLFPARLTHKEADSLARLVEGKLYSPQSVQQNRAVMGNNLYPADWVWVDPRAQCFDAFGSVPGFSQWGEGERRAIGSVADGRLIPISSTYSELPAFVLIEWE